MIPVAVKESEQPSSQPKTDSVTAAPQKDRDVDVTRKVRAIKTLNPASIQMLIAFRALNYRVYEGSVPTAVKVRRRKRDKAARISRRLNRGT